MGTTAQKIQYLYGTKTLLKDTINLTGAGITNDTFRSYANKLKLGLINALNDNGDTIYSNLEKVSGKGSNLSLTPTYEAPMRNREIYGNTLQNGTPTPSSPVSIQSVTGKQVVSISDGTNTDIYNIDLTSKNLFNDYGIVTATSRGITRCNVDDGIFIDGTYDKSGNLDIWLTESNSSTYTDKMVLLKANTEYTVSAKIIEGTISNTNTLMRISSRTVSDKSFGWNYQSMSYSDGEYKATFTPTADIYLGAIRIPLSSDVTISFDKVIIKIQVEVGSSSSDYVSYFTPIELNKIGTYEDSIKKSTGKNLCFNITKPANANLKFFVSKSLSKTFTISFTTNEALSNNSLYLEIDGTSYGNIGGITASANTRVEKTYTLSDTDYQAIQNGTNIDLLLYKNNANFNIPDDGMVENNSTATSYEPYGKVWYIEKNIGKVVLNGSENWTNFTTVAGSSNTMSQIDLPMQFLNRDGYTDRFPVIPDYSATEHFVIAGGLTHLYVHILNSRLSTLDVAGFKSWLASNITTFYYALKTPIYEVITNTELINQLETLYNAKSKDGTTNINVTSEDLSMILNVSVIKGDA